MPVKIEIKKGRSKTTTKLQAESAPKPQDPYHWLDVRN